MIDDLECSLAVMRAARPFLVFWRGRLAKNLKNFRVRFWAGEFDEVIPASQRAAIARVRSAEEWAVRRFTPLCRSMARRFVVGNTDRSRDVGDYESAAQEAVEDSCWSYDPDSDEATFKTYVNAAVKKRLATLLRPTWSGTPMFPLDDCVEVAPPESEEIGWMREAWEAAIPRLTPLERDVLLARLDGEVKFATMVVRRNRDTTTGQPYRKDGRPYTPSYGSLAWKTAKKKIAAEYQRIKIANAA